MWEELEIEKKEKSRRAKIFRKISLPPQTFQLCGKSFFEAMYRCPCHCFASFEF